MAPAASADTTVRLWRFNGAAAADAGPRYAAEEAACLQVRRISFAPPVRKKHLGHACEQACRKLQHCCQQL
jgi:hypothetical protein